MLRPYVGNISSDYACADQDHSISACNGYIHRPSLSRSHTTKRQLLRPRSSSACKSLKLDFLGSSRSGSRNDLWDVLVEQARRESLPWLQDLLQPLLQGPPEPLQGTLPPEQLADPDSQFISVAGVQLHYKEVVVGQAQGGGPGPTLLLLHGFNGSVFNWRHVMREVAEQVAARCGSCRVIAFDRPPFGLSSRPLEWQEDDEGPYTLAAGATLGAGLLRQLGAGPALVVGHSQGAAVAVEMAQSHPEVVCSLALVSPAVATSGKGLLARSDLGQLLRLAATRALLAADGPGLHYVRRQVMRRRDEVVQGRLGIYYDEARLDQEAISGYLLPLSSHDWDKGYLLMSRAFGLAGPPPDLAALAVPALVLVGQQDSTTPPALAAAVAEKLRGRPGCATRYVELQRCGHIPMEELPHSFAQELSTFACADVAWGEQGWGSN